MINILILLIVAVNLFYTIKYKPKSSEKYVNNPLINNPFTFDCKLKK